MFPEKLQKLSDIVERYFKSGTFDSSHDFLHVIRVVELALEIAKKEGIEDVVILRLITIVALLHDVTDKKYFSPVSSDGTILTEHDIITRILEEADILNCGLPSPLPDFIIKIIKNISYSHEVSVGMDELDELSYRVCTCVQDADRIDAIGAIGLARCFTFGGARNRPIFTFDEESKSSTTLQHFFDKLVKLPSMMKTETGKALAVQRGEVINTFLDNFINEVGISQNAARFNVQ